MIKFLEITSPANAPYAQARVKKIHVSEGKEINPGDTLITVESDGKEFTIPSEIKAKVIELIVAENEKISVLTPLILVETKVTKKQQSKKKSSKKQTKASKKQDTKKVTESKKTANKPQIEVIELTIPDVGDDQVKVIELLANIGDTLNVDDPIITLESDKASMDVPSTHQGVLKEILVEVGSDVSEGTIFAKLETSSSGDNSSTENMSNESPKQEDLLEPEVKVVDMLIPDVGSDEVKVIEILTDANATVAVDDPVITLESDKASMDVPATHAGQLTEITVKVGDSVKEGDVFARVETTESTATESKPAAQGSETPAPAPASAPTASPAPAAAPVAMAPAINTSGKPAHASPSIRRFARELGVDLGRVVGTGRKGRISKDDVKLFVKGIMLGGGVQQGGVSSGEGIPPMPTVDFSKFGETEISPLSKIKKLTAKNLHRAWLHVPHVTHNEEADVTGLEELRKSLKAEFAQDGIKITALSFIMQACANALKEFPSFNSSLENGGENLILKKYYNIGIAVDTEDGLVVPVVKDVDKKSIKEISKELGEISQKARDKKLMPKDMQGGTFTISSLGGIGGRSFTPIVNAPEVAIMGVSRSKMTPVWNGETFIPRLMLPLSLSYDHRVIDGAEAARFSAFVAAELAKLQADTLVIDPL